MARRRYQEPAPFREGRWWWIKMRQDEFVDGKLERKQKRVKVCLADKGVREAQRIARELLWPMNQGLETPLAALSFIDYIEATYRPLELIDKASTTRIAYEATLRKYLIPTFGKMLLRDLTRQILKEYLAQLGRSAHGGYVVLKIKEVFSSVLSSAVKYRSLPENHLLDIGIPLSKRINRLKPKPCPTPEEFDRLLSCLDEPYASMIFVAIHSGLRVSELAGLKWEDVKDGALTIDERYCRGDWNAPKTQPSGATIAVSPLVTDRIWNLRTIEVNLKWGGQGAHKRIKLVRSDGPEDLVFQSLRDGKPLNDQNIVRRQLRPAAERLGLDPRKATWRALRRARATWMVQAGVDAKAVQASMRHSRSSTTMEFYAQVVPDSQRRAAEQTMEMVNEKIRVSRANESRIVN